MRSSTDSGRHDAPPRFPPMLLRRPNGLCGMRTEAQPTIPPRNPISPPPSLKRTESSAMAECGGNFELK